MFKRFDETFFEEIFEDLRETLPAPDKKNAIVNPLRMKEMLHVHKILKESVVGSETYVTYEIDETFMTVACVTITGKIICFKNPDAFFEAVKLADNFEICPKTNGVIDINFSFYGTAKIID